MIAALTIPAKFLEKRLTNAEDRNIVQAMYDELKATGRVEHTLTEDDRTIRDLYAREVLEPKLAARREVRKARVPNGDPGEARRAARAAEAKLRPVAPASLAADTALDRAVAKSATGLTEVRTRPPALPKTAPVAATPAEKPAMEVASSDRLRRRYLTETDDLEAAPSIGPKMAARFADLGLATVRDFLDNDPLELAEILNDDRIDGETLTDWQDQARLVIEIPGLRGTHAQLLVGAGYRSAAAIAGCRADELAADVLKFAATSDGKRVLREGNAPDLEKIRDWLAAANEALAA